jgi:hypothetical protein
LQRAFDLSVAGKADQADGEIAQHGHGLSGGAGAGMLVVFSEHNITTQ